jgi:hypothetical protein
MGGAGAALARGNAALVLNPARLDAQAETELSAVHNAWIQDTLMDRAGLATYAGNFGLALGFDYLSFGSLSRYSLDPSGNVVPGGNLSPSAYDLCLGAGTEIMPDISLGLAGKVLTQNLDGSGSPAFAGDAGLSLETPLTGLALAAVVQDAGGRLEGRDLPARAKAGLGYEGVYGKGTFSLAADVTVPDADRSLQFYSAGAEIWVRDVLALRGGYNLNSRDGMNGTDGLSGGLGLRYRSLDFGYAFASMGGAGRGNQFSLAWRF